MQYFSTEDRDGAVIVRLQHGERNTLIPEMLEEGTSLFKSLAADNPDGGIVLTGDGDHFTCGMDTKVAATLDDAGVRRATQGINSFCASLHRLPCVLVAAVNGNTIGAGGIMLLCADWIYAAAQDYKIGLPEAKAGLPFPSVPQVILDYNLEPSWRRRLSLSSMLLSPNEAIAAGLVEATVIPEQLIESALGKAKEMSAQPGFRACKRQYRARANKEIDGIMGDR